MGNKHMTKNTSAYQDAPDYDLLTDDDNNNTAAAVQPPQQPPAYPAVPLTDDLQKDAAVVERPVNDDNVLLKLQTITTQCRLYTTMKDPKKLSQHKSQRGSTKRALERMLARTEQNHANAVQKAPFSGNAGDSETKIVKRVKSNDPATTWDNEIVVNGDGKICIITTGGSKSDSQKATGLSTLYDDDGDWEECDPAGAFSIEELAADIERLQ